MHNSTILKFGAIAGVAVVLWHLLFLSVDKKLYFEFGAQWGVLLFYILAMYFACSSEAKKAEGLYAWQPALRTAFGTFVVGYLIAHVFYFVLFKFIDPGLINLQAEILSEGIERSKDLLGEENAWKMQDQYKAEDFKPTLQKSAFSFAFGLIGGFILASIVAWTTYGKSAFNNK